MAFTALTAFANELLTAQKSLNWFSHQFRNTTESTHAARHGCIIINIMSSQKVSGERKVLRYSHSLRVSSIRIPNVIPVPNQLTKVA